MSRLEGTRRRDMKRLNGRRTATVERNRRILKIGGLALGLLLLVALPLRLYNSGWFGARMDQFITYTSKTGLGLDEIYLTGRAHTNAAAVMAALGIKPGDPLMGFDAAGARARLEALPWVRSAAVQRRFPDAIFVQLTERTPFAFWQRDRKLSLIDDTGAVLTTENLGRFKGLPQLIGEDAPGHAPALFRDLALYPEIDRRVRTATFIGQRRWNLRLENGVDIRLPENDVPTALARLAAAEAESSLLEKDIVVIDLRLSDRLVVQTTAEAAARRNAPKEGI